MVGPLLLALVVALVPAPVTALAAPSLPPLHADPDPREGGRIVDSLGREVLLRGVNVNSLAEDWSGNSFPTVFPLARTDPARMRAIGWNAVRLLVSWSRVEPSPGRYSRAYLRRVARTARRLAAHGLYTIIDLHQDAWGPSLAARPGRCAPPGAHRRWAGTALPPGQPSTAGPRAAPPAAFVGLGGLRRLCRRGPPRDLGISRLAASAST